MLIPAFAEHSVRKEDPGTSINWYYVLGFETTDALTGQTFYALCRTNAGIAFHGAYWNLSHGQYIPEDQFSYYRRSLRLYHNENRRIPAPQHVMV